MNEFSARYYDARISRWISTDPALQEGKYFPRQGDYDTEHDFYWYLSQDGSRKLAGLGGVFNAVNMDVYHYAGQNPVKLVDPDGRDVIIEATGIHANLYLQDEEGQWWKYNMGAQGGIPRKTDKTRRWKIRRIFWYC